MKLYLWVSREVSITQHPLARVNVVAYMLASTQSENPSPQLR